MEEHSPFPFLYFLAGVNGTAFVYHALCLAVSALQLADRGLKHEPKLTSRPVVGVRYCSQ